MAYSIKELCSKKPVSKDFIETYLWLTEETFNKIKNWEIAPSDWVAIKLAEYFNIEFDALISDINSKEENKTVDFNKYKQIIQNFIKYASDSDWKITKTKLAKLCYLLDFSWYYFNLTPVTWLEYKRLEQWPVPESFFRIIDEMQEEWKIDIETKKVNKEQNDGKIANMISNITNPELDKLSIDEIALLKRIAEKWKNKTRDEIVNFTHNQLAWWICKENQIIPYNFICQEDIENVF